MHCFAQEGGSKARHPLSQGQIAFGEKKIVGKKIENKITRKMKALNLEWSVAQMGATLPVSFKVKLFGEPVHCTPYHSPGNKNRLKNLKYREHQKSDEKSRREE